MKRILLIILVSICSFACTDEIYDFASVEGEWKLTGYNSVTGFDINDDGVKSVNLLEEIECTNNETLIFDSNGVMSSNNTFNPKIDIALKDGSKSEYVFNVECDLEGVIGFATGYSQNGDIITYKNHSASIIENQIFIVFENAIEIYNADYTEVIETQDLTLVYTKQELSYEIK
jgi:hypothetical protein